MTNDDRFMQPTLVDTEEIDPTKWELIPCAFCRGKGTDPFNQLSALSTCGSCHGRGEVLVPRPHIRCTFCNGTGSDKTFRCPVCQGAGVVETIPGPTCSCPECGGRGFANDSGLNCLRCRGRGLVSTSSIQK